MIEKIFDDDSLKNLRQLANENETGYSWVDGLLVHEIEGDVGEIYRRLVVPRVRHIEDGSRSPYGGLFSLQEDDQPP